jgi:hypothetical protein
MRAPKEKRPVAFTPIRPTHCNAHAIGKLMNQRRLQLDARRLFGFGGWMCPNADRGRIRKCPPGEFGCRMAGGAAAYLYKLCKDVL